MVTNPVSMANPKGRLVVFVRPHSVVQEELLGELIRKEFSVALLSDHTRVRDLFRLNPECIAFLNIDEGYSEADWQNLVRELGDATETAPVRIGIVTYNPDPELSRKYLLELMVSCGFVKLSLDLSESTRTILKVLEANEARGRRQYLRVPCIPGSALLNVVLDGESLVGSLLDLSSVGMSCLFARDPRFKAHSMVKNVQLKLKGILCQVSAVVMGTRAQPTDEPVYIFLFDPHTSEETRDKIRVYMRKTLQNQLDADLKISSGD